MFKKTSRRRKAKFSELQENKKFFGATQEMSDQNLPY